MIIPALTALAAFFSLARVLIEKFVPDKVTRKREFKSKRTAVEKMERWRTITHSMIAKRRLVCSRH